MALLSRHRLGIDLGTSNTLIYIENKGIALREPSIVAVDKQTRNAVKFGREALKLEGRTSENIEIIHLMKDGVISNFTLTKQFLAYLVNQLTFNYFNKPEVVICVPSNISKVEKKAVIDALKSIGVRKALVVEEPFAAAIGAKLNVHQAQGKMLVDIGGGTTDVAVISYGEIIASLTLPHAGNYLNDLIVEHVRSHYNVLIGKDIAERLKLTLANATIDSSEKERSMRVTVRNLVDNLPKQIEVNESVIASAINEVLDLIVLALKNVLSEIPPELVVDILENGVVLTGGSALIKGLPERLFDETGVPFHLVNTPLDTIAIGAGKLFDTMQNKARLVEKQRR